jgi:hypothetical protein
MVQDLRQETILYYLEAKTAEELNALLKDPLKPVVAS